MEEPYKLPTFLTKIIFVLEFLRQILYVESELFLKHKKYSNIKFKYTIEPFVVDSTSALPIIQDLLRSMKFDQIERSAMIQNILYQKGKEL